MSGENNGVDRAALRHLGWSSAVAFATYGAGTAVTYLAQLVIARTVGAESYGIYSYVLAWITILGYLAALGFDVSLLRLVPAYRTQGMFSLARGVIQYAERRAAAMALGIAVSGMAVVWLLGGRQTTQLAETFLIGFAVVPVLALLWIRASVVRGFGGVLSALAPDRLVRDGLLLLVISGLALSGLAHIGAPTVMAVTLASSLAGLALVTWNRRRRWLLPEDGTPPAYAKREWRRTALPLVAIAVAEAAMNRTGVVSLGWAGHTADAGVYAMVFNVTSIVVLPRIAVNTRFAPMVSEFFAQKNQAGLQELITRAASWTLIGAACMALPLFFLAAPVLSLFGPGFGEAVMPMRVLLVSQVIAAAAGSQIFLMTMTGQERSAAVVVVLAALGNFALAVPLIGLYGTTGAAIANAITLLLWNCAMAALIYRNLGAVPGVLAAFRWRRQPAKRSNAVGIA
jgi:O-antigen/teichoic acid export membrane protein